MQGSKLNSSGELNGMNEYFDEMLALVFRFNRFSKHSKSSILLI